jgi:hypothetical protein
MNAHSDATRPKEIAEPALALPDQPARRHP